MPAVEVAKYGDRIAVTLSAERPVEDQIERLCQTHGAGAVFVDGRSMADIKTEQAAPAAATEEREDDLERDPLDHDGDGKKGGSLPKSRKKGGAK